MNAQVRNKTRACATALAVLLAACLARANTAAQPMSRPERAGWLERHESFLQIARQGGVDVLFLGDSITDFWRTTGKEVWTENFAPLRAANFGLAGDRTEHLLWRIENGELDGIRPKVVVLLIGTNNTGKGRDGIIHNTVPEIVAAIGVITRKLETRLPAAKILLVGVFPRGGKDDPARALLQEVNAGIAMLDDGKRVRFLDCGARLLEPDGELSLKVMPDLLHPSEQGYQIWAGAMRTPLAELLK